MRISLLAAIALVCATPARAASAAPPSGTFNVVYTFLGGSDGAGPVGLVNAGGTLYGTTAGGGTTGYGTVFALDPATGAESVVHTFGGAGQDGMVPNGGPIDVAGALYGTTVLGGTHGNGAVFSIDLASGTESVLHSITGTQGSEPFTGVAQVGRKLYGTTRGKKKADGTVYAVNRSTGAGVLVHAFNGSDGQRPSGPLLPLAGKLYGTTYEGGAYGNGVVYAIDVKSSTETVVYAFKKKNDGAYPVNRLLAVNGLIFGTTYIGGFAGVCPTGGCGTIFSLNPSTGAETVLYSFKGAPDGASPSSSLVRIGDFLYGSTSYGGSTTGGCTNGLGCGVIYAFNMKSGAEAILHAFNQTSDGANPGELIDIGGTLYGVANSDEGGGGDGCGFEGCGTVFSYAP